ncbi:helix-turn-helix domain-containing protein [Streptomyces sp. NPDC006733]|uniref:helix-turn-helix domain-containing protein n=1 Tax=Streptomyces sp. NPDC006733 TaxID=3155460 RepID=UPI0033F6D512
MGSPGTPGLADLLESLKQRSGLSYAALAGRCRMSTSTLHRYCRGQVVPDSFGMVERIGRACGATREELNELHSYWLRADEQRAAGTPPDVASDAGAPAAPTGPSAPVPPARRGLIVPMNRPLPWAVVLVLLACLTLTASSGRSAGGRAAEPQWIPGPSWQQAPRAVPATLFGVTMNSSTGTMPAFHVGAVRLWDSGTRWSQLEPQRGVFDWAALDRLVGGANRAALPVLFTFGGTPRWASPEGPKTAYDDGSRASPPDDLADWDTYVRVIATRYRGRVEAYEMWNLAPSPNFFTGSPSKLAEMTRRASRIIKGADPQATVVCPGIGELWQQASRTFLSQFAAAGGYEHCDVAAVKLHQKDFGDKPETMVELAGLIDRTFHQAGFHLRLWNTGAAHRIAVSAPLSEEQADNYAVRFYLIGLYTRYERMYFYNWGGTKIPIVLQADGGAPTRAALFVEELQRWLRGARITSCGHGLPDNLPANVWQCRFLLPSGSGDDEPAAIVWADSGEAVMTAQPGAYRVRHLDGHRQEIREGAELRITERPALVEYQTATASNPWRFLGRAGQRCVPARDLSSARHKLPNGMRAGYASLASRAPTSARWSGPGSPRDPPSGGTRRGKIAEMATCGSGRSPYRRTDHRLRSRQREPARDRLYRLRHPVRHHPQDR